ncbi:MAG: MBL fold metallo-hydrolase, partial [Lentimicrobium sp.]|nr:MBL fold metallo-hydrolase [Lentimicrobium sp.]
RILRGDKEVSIYGVLHEVRAKIERIEAFSGHADSSEMLDFISCQDKKQVRKVFLVHGEFEAQSVYRETLIKAGFTDVEIPSVGNEYTL